MTAAPEMRSRRPRTRVYATKGREVVFAAVDDLLVQVISAPQVSDELWTEACEATTAFYREERPFSAQLAYSPSAGPNARQRDISKKYQEQWTGFDEIRHLALLTDSIIVRGAVTALSWIMPKQKFAMKAYACREHAAALKWLAAQGSFDETEGTMLFRELVAYSGLPPLP